MFRIPLFSLYLSRFSKVVFIFYLKHTSLPSIEFFTLFLNLFLIKLILKFYLLKLNFVSTNLQFGNIMTLF